MSLPWSEIPFAGGNVDGDPVRGSVSEVESVVTMFDRMGTAAENIHSTFETLKDDGGDSDSLRGDAADQFREIVEAVSGSLGDLPRVAGEAHGILNDHLTRLEDLRVEAASALVRANTRWEEVEGARSAVGSAESTNTRLQGQVNDLPPAGENPVADGDRPGAESAADGALEALGIAQGNLEEAEADLAASKTEWGGLREDEDSLNSDTSGRLDDIGLGDLSDPSWWESLLGAAFDLLMDLSLLDELFALIEAIATGDWAAALWMLKDILDTVMLIVAVVALFTPLGPLVAVLALTYLAATATLYFTQWPNPETGETVSGLDLAFAVADVIPGGAAVSATRRAVRRGYSSAADAVSTAARRGGRATPSPGAATPPGSASPTPPRTGDGPVVFNPPIGATPAEVRQVQDYVAGSNRALDAGHLSPTGRVSTDGELRRQAWAGAGGSAGDRRQSYGSRRVRDDAPALPARWDSRLARGRRDRSLPLVRGVLPRDDGLQPARGRRSAR